MIKDLLFIGIFAYSTTRGFVGEFITTITQNETLLKISALLINQQLNIFAVLTFLCIALWFLTKSFKRMLSLGDGVLVGLIVACGWYITGVIGAESMEREIVLNSMSFVYPSAQIIELFSYYQVIDLSFGVSIILGVVTGAFTMSRFNKKYSFGCTSNLENSKIKYNMIGGALMGIGGVLAVGCTVGQGLTGMSTLALASFVAIVSIMTSAFVTAKYLNKKEKLPMCFIFEWDDKK